MLAEIKSEEAGTGLSSFQNDKGEQKSLSEREDAKREQGGIAERKQDDHI
jgi:hypothetical protein